MKKTNTRYSLISLAAACLFGGLPHAVQADYYSAVTNLNPVAYYRLGETVMVPPGDVATNYGALGGVAYFRNGVTHGDAGALVGSADTAATFTSGSQQAAFYPYQTNLSQTNAFTVEAWLKPTALSGTMCALSHVGFVGPNVRNGWVLYQIASGANFIWSFRTYPGGNNINAVVTLNSSPISAGTWYHVAVVYQTNRVALFVDGVEAASANNPGPLAANYVLPFAIGARSENASWWGGTADEVAYYTNALSAAEIAAHYSNGTNPSPSPSYDTLIQAQNPLLYFRMNEPAWSAGTPVTAVNSGSLGAGADGSWNAGAVAGVSGPRPPEFAGFEANNTAGQFNHYYGNVSAPALLDNLTEYTISAWVRRQVLWISSLTIGAIAGQNAVCQFAWSTHQNDNGEVIGAYVWPGSTYGRQVKAAALPMYQWHHVAITVADGRVVIYENGVGAVTNTEAYSATIANGAAFGIGGGMITGQRDGFAGNIDEVAVFTSALSAAQIKALYEAAGPVPRVTSITRTPADPVFVGANITNTVVATGPGPITYQWRKDGTPVGAATNVFIVLNAQASDSGSYDVVLTNPNGSVTSRVDVLTIQASPPAIFTQPASVARCEGVSATFSVTAGGTEPLFYQWRKDATPIAGATASSYTINLVTAADAGNYDVVVTNSVGSMTSSNATLTVVAVTNYSALVLAYGPKAYWRLSETSGTTVYDNVGIANGATQGGINMNVPGMTGPTTPGLESGNTCFRFDGTNGYVAALTNVVLNTNAITIIALVKREGMTSSARIVGGFPPGGTHIAFWVDDSGQLVATFGNISGGGGWGSGLIVPDNTWCFVAWVISPATEYMYLDDGNGLQVASRNNASSTQSFFTPNIGFQPGGSGGGYFQGLIDEVAIYCKPLSVEQITELDQMLFLGPTAPRFVQQPLSQVRNNGETAVFSVNMAGSPPYAYQWYRGTNPISGATSATYSFTVGYSDVANYWVRVSNPASSTNSDLAALQVLVPNPTYANLTDGLVLHLKLNGDLRDSSGHGNHAAVPDTNTFPLSIAPTFTSPGVLGANALQYGSTSGGPYAYATLGASYNLPDLTFGSDVNFSISYWIKTAGGDLPVFSDMDIASSGLGFSFAPRYNSYLWFDWTWSYTLRGDTTLTVGGADTNNIIGDGDWHNLVHTFDRAGNAATYLDGVQVDSRPMPNLGNIDSSGTINIGQDSTGIYDVNGQAEVEDIGVWRRALWPAEATVIYKVGRNYTNTFDTAVPIIMTFQQEASDWVIYWQDGTLEQNSDLNNPSGWTPVAGAAPPRFVVPFAAGNKFYRVTRPYSRSGRSAVKQVRPEANPPAAHFL